MSSNRKRAAIKKANMEVDRLRQKLMLCEHHKSVYESMCMVLAAECDSRQAKIDSLMLEFCPEEMTKEQIKTWQKNQKRGQE